MHDSIYFDHRCWININQKGFYATHKSARDKYLDIDAPKWQYTATNMKTGQVITDTPQVIWKAIGADIKLSSYAERGHIYHETWQISRVIHKYYM